jgi:hypothetical protein
LPFDLVCAVSGEPDSCLLIAEPFAPALHFAQDSIGRKRMPLYVAPYGIAHLKSFL